MIEKDFSHVYVLLVDLHNKGAITAKAFGMDMFFPHIYSPAFRTLTVEHTSMFSPQEPHKDYDKIRFRNVGDPLSYLFPGEKLSLFGGEQGRRLVYTVKDEDREKSFLYNIIVTTYADDMPPKRFEYPFNKFIGLRMKE